MIVNVIKTVRRKPRSRKARLGTLLLTAVNNFIEPGTEQLECDLVFNTREGAPLASVDDAVPAHWTMRYNGFTYICMTIANVSYNTLHLTLEAHLPQAGANLLNYWSDPSDISDVLARQLGPITDFPI